MSNRGSLRLFPAVAAGSGCGRRDHRPHDDCRRGRGATPRGSRQLQGADVPHLMNTVAAFLEISGLSKSFAPRNGGGPTDALRDVTLEVSEGEFVCLVGPSGCGKSTLLNIVAGLESASAGVVRVGGRIVS